MKKKRLLALADHMDRLDPERYNQDSWVTLVGDLTQKNAELSQVLPGDTADYHGFRKVTFKEGACGTVACVLGNAVGVTPGLFFSADNIDYLIREDGTFVVTDLTPAVMVRDDIFVGWDAAAYVYGIPDRHAFVLFGATDQYTTRAFYEGTFTPKNVAEKLREYVATNGKNVKAIINGDD